jgi:CheY-like chemotaxis protein
VDDDSIGPLLVEALSEETPYKALLVTDGCQALRVASDIKPCLFITDYRLPRMNGIELYDRLHLAKELADTPAIIMSAYLPDEEVAKRKLVLVTLCRFCHPPEVLLDISHTSSSLKFCGCALTSLLVG